ncbi:MAG: type 1 glutamine amidotransferase [Rhodospirillaceae bacterium]|nr:type 1 glutamine amidotransferase [Rhodospirillaceae bacterium]
MKLGILKTGQPPRSLADHFPGYPEMIQGVLGSGYDYRTFDVQAGALPQPGDADAYIVTGSAAGVYDDLPWIEPLRAWLRGVDPELPVMGICFGHQIMADAYGGKVIKSDKGWGGGLQDYAVLQHEPWMEGAGKTFAIPASHQDQVVEAPPTARVIAGNDFCPNAGLVYTGRRAASFQGHPEFSPAYAGALVDLRHRKGIIDDATSARLHDSLTRPNDNNLVGAWIRNFCAR